MEMAKASAMEIRGLMDALVYCEIAEIAALQAESGDVPGAKATAEQIEQAAGKALAFSKIAIVQAKARDIASARTSLAAAKTATSSVADRSRKEWLAGEVLPELAKAGNWTDVAEFAAIAVEDASTRCECLTKAAEELCPAQCKAIPKEMLAKVAAETLSASEDVRRKPGHSSASHAVGRDMGVSTATTDLSSSGTSVGSRSAEDAGYLTDLLRDLKYGAANRMIAQAISNRISKKDLGVKIGTLNNLAKQAEMSDGKLQAEFGATVESLKQKGITEAEVMAIDALADNIAWRLAYEQQQKKKKN